MRHSLTCRPLSPAALFAWQVCVLTSLVGIELAGTALSGTVLAGFMLHVYATKIKPGLTTDKWMPESMRSDTRSNCEARQACY